MLFVNVTENIRYVSLTSHFFLVIKLTIFFTKSSKSAYAQKESWSIRLDDAFEV